MDYGLLGGIAQGLQSGVEAYGQASDRKRKIEELRIKQEIDKAERKRQEEEFNFREGAKRDEKGNIIPDPSSPVHARRLLDQESKRAQIAGLLGKEALAKTDQELKRLQTEADIANKGLIKTKEGTIELSPEEKQRRDVKSGVKPRAGKSGAGGPTTLIPGYTYDPSMKLSPKEIGDMRTAVSDANKLNGHLSKMRQLIDSADEKDLANPFSQVNKDINQEARSAQLIYKSPSFAQLGVLTGPDLSILEQVIERPTAFGLLTGGGKAGLSKRLQNVEMSSKGNLLKSLEARGIRPVGGGNDQEAKMRRLQELRAKAGK